MEGEAGASSCWRAHVVFLPVPAQGHINPMLNFSKTLASKGVKVTLAAPLFTAKSIQVQNSSITVEAYSDGYDQGGMRQAGSFDAYFERVKDVGAKNICRLIEAHQNSNNPVKCLIYSSVYPFAAGIAKRLGIIAASFFTQSCAVSAIFYHVHRGDLSTPVQAPAVSLPGLPLLGAQELPSVLTEKGDNQFLLHLLSNQFSNIDDTNWLLFNTFDLLEEEIVHLMGKKWPEKAIAIGPTVRSNNDSGQGPSIEWLNTKAKGSVVYVSFGSVVKLGEDQMEELTWWLKTSKKYFLWVVRTEDEHKLPTNFKEETAETGLVVSWCPQLEVLAHEAVECFVTHCGWNSTLEALSLGVAMIAMPQQVDQPTNAKFVEDVWRVGVRVKVDEKGTASRGDIEDCIEDVMQGKKGEEIKRNVVRWRELAKEAIDEGGSSERNIEKFLAGICI